MENPYFPLFYDITGWNLCFFGAGKIAERRIKILLEYSCRIYIISKEATKAIQSMAEKGAVVWVREEVKKEEGKQQIEKIWEELEGRYQEYFFKEKGFQIVFACTNDRTINQIIYEYCKRRGIEVNVADCKKQSDFYFPGLLRWEELVIGVVGNGNNHKKVKQVMDKLRKLFYLYGWII